MAQSSHAVFPARGFSNRLMGLGPEDRESEMSFSGWEQKRLFHQLPDGRFEECAFPEGFDSRADGRSLIAVDIDGDGDQDLLMLNRAAPKLQLFRNDGPVGHAVALTAVATHGAPEAPGAKIYVRDARGERVFPVLLARGYGSSVDPTVHVGLGDETQATVTVQWPDGGKEEFGAVAPGGRYELLQGSHRARRVSEFAAATGAPQPPPPLALKDLFPSEKGPLLVPLLAKWCKTCWTDVGELNALYKSKRWRVHGFDYEAAPQLASTIKQMKVAFPLESVGDAREARLAAWGVNGLPAALVFAADGSLSRILQGPITADALEFKAE